MSEWKCILFAMRTAVFDGIKSKETKRKYYFFVFSRHSVKYKTDVSPKNTIEKANNSYKKHWQIDC